VPVTQPASDPGQPEAASASEEGAELELEGRRPGRGNPSPTRRLEPHDSDAIVTTRTFTHKLNLKRPDSDSEIQLEVPL